MKSTVLGIILFLISFCLRGQHFIYNAPDTLTYNSRAGSSKNDSLDLLFAANIQINPGGSLYHPFGALQNEYFSFSSYFSQAFLPFQRYKTTYTTLPHLGFMYSFGSKGIQLMHTEFQQLINKNTLLNFDFRLNALGEMIRNGSHRNSSIHLQLLHSTRKVKNDFLFSYQQSKIGLNGGLADTNSVDLYPIPLLTINKDNASSKQLQLNLQNQLALNLLKDSLLFFGPTLKNKWEIQNRTYEEQDDLSVIYGDIFIDSNKTRDQFQIAKISSGAGIYFKNKSFGTELLLNHTYWDYQNLARHNDTNELNIDLNTSFHRQFFDAQNELKINLLGAIGEVYEQLSIKYATTRWKLGFNYSFRQYLPYIQQRNYFANNFQWKTPLNLQKTQSMQLTFGMGQKITFFTSLSYKNMINNYFFIQNQWRNDTLQHLHLASLQTKLGFRFKTLGIQPYLALNYASANFSYLPSLDARLRLFFQKKLFKDKKLDFIIGIEGSYISSHALLNYQPALGVYEINSLTNRMASTSGLDFFTGFQANIFRFYLRLENLDYLWADNYRWSMLNYPLSPLYFRIGITWDFFN